MAVIFFILKTIKFVYGKPILGFYFFRKVVGGGDMQEAKNTNARTSLFNIHVVWFISSSWSRCWIGSFQGKQRRGNGSSLTKKKRLAWMPFRQLTPQSSKNYGNILSFLREERNNCY